MLEDVMNIMDTVLVMSVNPGFGGQKFIPGAYQKIRQLNQSRARYNASFRIEVDGASILETRQNWPRPERTLSLQGLRSSTLPIRAQQRGKCVSLLPKL